MLLTLAGLKQGDIHQDRAWQLQEGMNRVFVADIKEWAALTEGR